MRGAQPIPDLHRTAGTSMWPLIRDGSVIAIEPVPAEQIRPGDIIAFRRDDEVIVHRVLAVRANGGARVFLEKGDNHCVATQVEEPAYLGRAAWVRRDGTRLRLDRAQAPRCIALLTACLRIEAAVCRPFVRLARGPLRARLPRVHTALTALFRAVLLPVKLPLAALLAFAYRTAADSNPGSSLEAVNADRFVHQCVLCALRLADGPPAAPGPFLSWQSVLVSATAHGVLPQMRAVLAADARITMDETVRKHLDHAFHRVMFTHLAAVQTAHEVHTALSGAGIAYAVLKGPRLAEDVYPSGMPRMYGDLDLLVPHASLPAAIAALERAGYKLSKGAPIALLKRIGHFHCVLTPSRKGRVKIELHWALVDSVNLMRIPAAEVLAGIRQTALRGTPSAALGLEDEFLYLCLHLSKHALFNRFGLASGQPPAWFRALHTGNRLLWLIDLHLFLANYENELRWQELIDKALSWNAYDELRESVAVLHLLLPSPLSRRAADRLAIPSKPAAGRPNTLFALLFRGKHGARLLAHAMRMSDRFLFRPVRILTLGELLFPAPGKLKRYYRTTRTWLVPLLYMVHPFLLFLKIFRQSEA